VKSPIAQPEKSRVAAINAKGHGRFLATMVAIIGGFKARFRARAAIITPGAQPALPLAPTPDIDSEAHHRNHPSFQSSERRLEIGKQLGKAAHHHVAPLDRSTER